MAILTISENFKYLRTTPTTDYSYLFFSTSKNNRFKDYDSHKKNQHCKINTFTTPVEYY